jgi:hypothetical protein
MPPEFHSTSVPMIEDGQDRRWRIGGGFPASVLVHVAALALLIFGLPPLSFPELPKEEAVQVELVPPPEEEEEAKQAPAEELPAPPEPPAPEAPPQEQAEPQPGQQAQQEMPADSPPVEPPEQEAKQTPASQEKPPVEQVPPAKAAAPPNEPAGSAPVVQFGEEDSGPRRSPDGDSAEEGKAAEMETEAPIPPAMSPEVLAANGAGGGSSTQPAGAVSHAEDGGSPPLDEAAGLLSNNETGDPFATTAMRNMPRSRRGGQLCYSELLLQLRRAGRLHSADDRVPRYELKSGTVIDVARSAFRTAGQWHDVGFRCEVDADAMKVVSFAFRVGGQIPASEWRKRDLPSR